MWTEYFFSSVTSAKTGLKSEGCTWGDFFPSYPVLTPKAGGTRPDPCALKWDQCQSRRIILRWRNVGCAKSCQIMNLPEKPNFAHTFLLWEEKSCNLFFLSILAPMKFLQRNITPPLLAFGVIGLSAKAPRQQKPNAPWSIPLWRSFLFMKVLDIQLFIASVTFQKIKILVESNIWPKGRILVTQRTLFFLFWKKNHSQKTNYFVNHTTTDNSWWAFAFLCAQ